MVQKPVLPSGEGCPVVLWEGSFLRQAHLCLCSPASVHHVLPCEVLPRRPCGPERRDNQVRLNFPQPRRPVGEDRTEGLEPLGSSILEASHSYKERIFLNITLLLLYFISTCFLCSPPQQNWNRVSSFPSRGMNTSFKLVIYKGTWSN